MNNTDLLTDLINQYTQAFSSYYSSFLNWGKWLFFSFASISLVWLCIWRAFDKESLLEAMPGFLKEFFLLSFFYTIMLNGGSWLSSIVDTAQSMGLQLTQQLPDPASIIQEGISIANRVFLPLKNSASLNSGMSSMLIQICYLLILAAFITTATQLAITLLTTTFFISLSGIFLAFSAFSFSRSIARRTIDHLIAYSIKLLALYLVINAGAGIFKLLASYLPEEKMTSWDVYVWASASAALFGACALLIPKYTASLFFNSLKAKNEHI
jgi:type IV secretion system protein TrbL